jgi:predicted DNA-binding WGR domain protein
LHRWELVGDGVAEFWEVESSGVEVTVRCGRLGTAGRSGTTSFDSEAVATAHVGELIAEKEKEGYASAPAFTMPTEWWPHVHVRRGGRLRSDSVVAAGAVEEVRATLAERLPAVETVLADSASDQELVAAAHAHLAGEATPLGAAVLAVLLGSEPLLADAWVLKHGLSFAACAAVETHCVEVHRNDYGKVPPHLRRLPLEHRFDTGSVRRVRSLLAVASDEEHESAMAAVGACRTDLRSMLAATYLFPGRQDWVDEAFDEIERTSIPPYMRGLTYGLLSYAYSTVAQLNRSLAVGGMERYLNNKGAMFTVVDGIGPDVVPVLASILDLDLEGDFRDLILETLVEFPTAQAFDGLLVRLKVKRAQRTVLDMARRNPVVALERFVAAKGAQAKPLLERHLKSYPELADRVDLPEDVRAFVEEMRAAKAGVEDAPVDALPAVLVDPPWVVKDKPKPPKPVVVKGLTAPDHRAVEWEPGEQAEWGRQASNTYRTDDWGPLIDLFRAGDLDYERQVGLFLGGPVDELRPLVPEWNRGFLDVVSFLTKGVVARFEVDVMSNALDSAVMPKGDKGLVLPLVSLETARLVAQWLVKLKSTRDLCVTWLRRHPVHAARFLVPDAVGPVGAARRVAEAALRVIPEQAAEAAREYGPEAEKVIADMLAVDVVVPVKAPTLGKWVDLSVLPPVLLRGTKQALPAEAVGHLLTLLALSTPDDGHADVKAVRAVCDEASLARFSLELFEVWRTNGMPAKDGWVFTALGLLGDDEAARRLVPLIRAWPGEAQHARAVTGLAVLAAIGTDTALAALNSIAQRVKFTGIKNKAQEKIRDVAAGMGLTAEELGDRLVPDFGLDDAATMTIDYGSRRFTIGFDEQLKPFVLDESGKRLKDLPKPGAKDDGELALAEHKRFAQLKKDVRTIAGDQVIRLERSMVLVRRWPAAQFRTLLAGHPLLRHLVRRLVWVTEDGRSFRLAEDNTLADVHDETFDLPDDAVVGVAHPLHLGDAVAAWAKVFADYEILQPFPQLGRPVYRLTEAELSSRVLDRFTNVEVEIGRLLGLTKGAWERGAPMDAGIEHEITRPLPGGGSIEMALNPGIVVGAPDEFGPQTLGEVHLGGKRTFAEVDPVTASELLAELTSLKG